MVKATRLRKPQIAHLLRAVAGVTGHASFVMVGTGAVIARSKVLALDLMRTREIDSRPGCSTSPPCRPGRP